MAQSQACRSRGLSPLRETPGAGGSPGDGWGPGPVGDSCGPGCPRGPVGPWSGCVALESRDGGPARPTAAAGTNRAQCALSCGAGSPLPLPPDSNWVSPHERAVSPEGASACVSPSTLDWALTTVSHTSLWLWTCTRSPLACVLPGRGPCEHRA